MSDMRCVRDPPKTTPASEQHDRWHAIVSARSRSSCRARPSAIHILKPCALEGAGLEQLPIGLEKAPGIAFGVKRSPCVRVVTDVPVHARADDHVRTRFVRPIGDMVSMGNTRRPARRVARVQDMRFGALSTIVGLAADLKTPALLVLGNVAVPAETDRNKVL